METIQLKIKKVGSWMSRKIPYVICFRNEEIGNMYVKEEDVFTIPKAYGVIKLREVGSKIAFHPVEKEIVLFPENISESNMVECQVEAKINWMGVLTYGIFGPIRHITLTLK